MILKSLAYRIEPGFQRDVLLFSWWHFSRFPWAILWEHLAYPWQRKSNIIVAILFYIKTTSVHFLYLVYANCFFFFWQRNYSSVWKPQAGHKDIKVSHNHKEHMQIFHINNSQLSTGTVAPRLRLKHEAVCLALVKGTKSPSSDVLFWSFTCSLDWCQANNQLYKWILTYLSGRSDL